MLQTFERPSKVLFVSCLYDNSGYQILKPSEPMILASTVVAFPNLRLVLHPFELVWHEVAHVLHRYRTTMLIPP